MATIRIGISGWRYTPWRGVFYPPKMPQRLELWYASRILPTIEINGSFYSLQRPEYFRQWHDETPDDFMFAVKGPRFITHMKKLRDVETPLANFFASGFSIFAKSSAPSCGSFHRISAMTATSSKASLSYCRATPTLRCNLRVDMITD